MLATVSFDGLVQFLRFTTVGATLVKARCAQQRIRVRCRFIFIAKVLVYFNCAVNPFLYYMMSDEVYRDL